MCHVACSRKYLACDRKFLLQESLSISCLACTYVIAAVQNCLRVREVNADKLLDDALFLQDLTPAAHGMQMGGQQVGRRNAEWRSYTVADMQVFSMQDLSPATLSGEPEQELTMQNTKLVIQHVIGSGSCDTCDISV